MYDVVWYCNNRYDTHIMYVRASTVSSYSVFRLTLTSHEGTNNIIRVKSCSQPFSQNMRDERLPTVGLPPHYFVVVSMIFIPKALAAPLMLFSCWCHHPFYQPNGKLINIRSSLKKKHIICEQKNTPKARTS